MLKYVETLIGFSEVPEEITLCINISNCPCNCVNCHSSYLSKDIGTELNENTLSKLIEENTGISCVSFMGGDREPWYIDYMATYIRANYPNIKIAWYSGRQELHDSIKTNIEDFDYIKLGPYIEELGPLNIKTTNQRFYKVVNGELKDITYKFWK